MAVKYFSFHIFFILILSSNANAIQRIESISPKANRVFNIKFKEHNPEEGSRWYVFKKKNQLSQVQADVIGYQYFNAGSQSHTFESQISAGFSTAFFSIDEASSINTIEDLPPSSKLMLIERTVPDTTPPQITRLGPETIFHEIHTSFVDPGYSAQDVEDGDITPKVIRKLSGNLALSNLQTLAFGTYNITYNVQDAAGNPGTPVTRQVQIIDSTPPIFTLNGSPTIDINVGDPYYELGATAYDSYYGYIPSAFISIIGTPPHTLTPGVYVIRYNVSDFSGNQAPELTRILTIHDNVAPTINLYGDNPLAHSHGTPYVEPGFDVYDAIDGVIPNQNVSVSGSVNTNTVGTYTLTYSVNDSAGNTDTVTRDVIVQDLTKPVISLYGPSQLTYYFTGSASATFNDPGATAWDNFDGDITDRITVVSNVVMNALGDYEVRYSATDNNGNTQELVRNVKIVGFSCIEIDANYNHYQMFDYTTSAARGLRFYMDQADIYAGTSKGARCRSTLPYASRSVYCKKVDNLNYNFRVARVSDGVEFGVKFYADNPDPYIGPYPGSRCKASLPGAQTNFFCQLTGSGENYYVTRVSDGATFGTYVFNDRKASRCKQLLPSMTDSMYCKRKDTSYGTYALARISDHTEMSYTYYNDEFGDQYVGYTTAKRCKADKPPKGSPYYCRYSRGNFSVMYWEIKKIANGATYNGTHYSSSALCKSALTALLEN